MINGAIAAFWGVVLLSAVGLFLIRWRLVDTLKKFGWPDLLLALGEGIFTFGAGIFAEQSELLKRASWDNPAHSEHTLLILACCTECGLFGVAAKWLLDKVKERDKETIAELGRHLTRAQEALANWRRLVGLIRGLIDRKIQLVSTALADNPRSTALPSTVERQTQVETVLQLIHRFFQFDLEQRSPGKHRMRLGLYLPDSAHSKLVLYYSWDGSTRDCFGQKAPDAMMLTSPKGIFSEICRTYHLAGTRQLQLIPDCVAADTKGSFRFFYPLQCEHLKSMLAFKYVFQHKGTEDALVLAIDCDEAGFFAADRADEISEILDEMLVRFEYELVGLEAAVSELEASQPE